MLLIRPPTKLKNGHRLRASDPDNIVSDCVIELEGTEFIALNFVYDKFKVANYTLLSAIGVERRGQQIRFQITDFIIEGSS